MSNAEINVYFGINMQPVEPGDRLIFQRNKDLSEITPKLSEDQKGELFRSQTLNWRSNTKVSFDFVLDDRNIWVGHDSSRDVLLIRSFPLEMWSTKGNPIFGKLPINNSLALTPGGQHEITGKRITRVSPTQLVRRNVYISIKHL